MNTLILLAVVCGADIGSPVPPFKAASPATVAPAPKAAAFDPLYTYAEGVKVAEAKKLPLLTFVGNYPKTAKYPGYVLAAEDKLTGFPDNCVVVSIHLGSKHLGRAAGVSLVENEKLLTAFVAQLSKDAGVVVAGKPCPAGICANCNCPEGACATGACPNKAVLASGTHSHTCSKGHTWSHRDGDPGASHNCPVCGEFQNVVNESGRVYTQTSVQPVRPTFQFVPQTFGTQPACPNGRCPNQR